MEGSIIVIPSLSPNEGLIRIVKDILDCNYEVLVINDGSDAIYDSVFDRIKQSGATVLVHESNCGKGRALKTAFEYIIANKPGRGVVTADADGQHLVSDIINICKELEKTPNEYIFGERNFSGKDVPLRSRIGNRFTSFFFKINNGFECHDTQTGLRGYPACYLKDFLNVEGERYEYEMNTLNYASKNGIKVRMVGIETVYSEDNVSHFRAVRDSIIIYRTPLKFLCSSLCGALIDLTLFTVLCNFISEDAKYDKVAMILYATVLARIVSGLCNFFLNKYWCFNSRKRTGLALLKYSVLFVGIMLSSWGLVSILSMSITNITVAKMCVDSFLFIVSYYIQKRWVF